VPFRKLKQLQYKKSQSQNLGIRFEMFQVNGLKMSSNNEVLVNALHSCRSWDFNINSYV